MENKRDFDERLKKLEQSAEATDIVKEMESMTNLSLAAIEPADAKLSKFDDLDERRLNINFRNDMKDQITAL